MGYGTRSLIAHEPALDGLRGLAIALVVLFHLNLLGFGWVGVQLFFVLSGFLITRQLLHWREQHANGPVLREFYLRRALRIFPAYFVYLGLVLLLCATLARHTDEGQRVLAQWPSAALYYYNWTAQAPDHARTFFLTHLWSLCIEEQFYLLWPALLLLLRGRALMAALIALVLAGPLLRWTVFTQWPTPAAVAINTLSQLDAFATGALLTQVRALPRPALSLGAALLVALLLGAALGSSSVATPLALGYANTLPQQAQWLLGYSAINGLAAFLLLAVRGGWGAGLFQSGGMRRIGQRSYALYLWHFPLAHILGALIPWVQAQTGLGAMAVTLLWAPLYLLVLWGFAAASWHAIEAPALRLKTRWSGLLDHPPPSIEPAKM